MSWFNAAWLVIGYSALVDSMFAFAHRASFQDWELNPIAKILGVYLAVAFRLFTVGFGYLVIKEAKEPLRSIVTGFILLIHVVLLLVYIFS